MNLMPRSFRVRRASTRPGQADTLHVLEWLGGEAFVVTPPRDAIDEPPRREPPASTVQEEASPDWCVI